MGSTSKGREKGRRTKGRKKARVKKGKKRQEKGTKEEREGKREKDVDPNFLRHRVRQVAYFVASGLRVT